MISFLFFLLKKFKLLPWRIWLERFFAIKKVNISELFIGDTHYSYFSILGKKRLYSLDMYFGILHTCTMANINRKLKHCEAVATKSFAKKGILFLVLFCFSWQVEKNKNPHNPIFAESVHSIFSDWLNIMLCPFPDRLFF